MTRGTQRGCVTSVPLGLKIQEDGRYYWVARNIIDLMRIKSLFD
jgi:hypothetical protein